jgi:regulation of enolase protein 1 (concanavalin A-like superfamily)
VASAAAAEPNSVARPVPTTSAVAVPVCAIAPRNSAFHASAAVVAVTPPVRLSTG